uniref:C2H2-type domain-containing protein n=1 Tax=Gouania willdenowi TaxID=441366 RepID=A0A8C5GTH1_GOUWI
ISNLIRHKVVHTGVKKYECDECGKTFSRSVNLSRHVLIHRGIKAHRCEQCGKTLTRRSSLTLHMQTHSRTVLYHCDHCGKIYKQKQTLIEHLRSHTGHEVCPCDQCDKVFTTYQKLKSHQISHSSERPHKCDTCGKSYKWKFHLDHHQRVHEKNVLRCDECGKTFSTSSVLHSHLCVDGDMEQESSSDPSDTRMWKSHLNLHQRVHEKNVFRCDECGKTFSTSSVLHSHLCHVTPLVPVHGLLRTLPDFNGLFNPTFVFVFFCPDDPRPVPIYNVYVSLAVV